MQRPGWMRRALTRSKNKSKKARSRSLQDDKAKEQAKAGTGEQAKAGTGVQAKADTGQV
jgi:hypothetical protein